MITFAPSDRPVPHLEALATDIKDAVFQYRNRRYEIDRFLRHSKNTIATYQAHYDRWSRKYMLKNTPSDEREFAVLLGRIGTECTSDEEWQKLRGIIAEKLFEPYFKEKHLGSDMGFGVKVLINGVPVIYQPSTQTTTDKRRQSVDAGAWDTKNGEFVEVKFNPEIFEEKDINYLKHLEQQLEANSVSHTILVVSFSDPIVTKNELIAKKLVNKDSNFVIIGPDEFLPY
ncbi:MAG TPA: hypothetical protein VIG45_00505 [Erysipelothrix sp.]